MEKFDELAQNMLDKAERQPEKKIREVEEEMEEEEDFDCEDDANGDGEEVVEMRKMVKVDCGA